MDAYSFEVVARATAPLFPYVVLESAYEKLFFLLLGCLVDGLAFKSLSGGSSRWRGGETATYFVWSSC